MTVDKQIAMAWAKLHPKLNIEPAKWHGSHLDGRKSGCYLASTLWKDKDAVVWAVLDKADPCEFVGDGGHDPFVPDPHTQPWKYIEAFNAVGWSVLVKPKGIELRDPEGAWSMYVNLDAAIRWVGGQ